MPCSSVFHPYMNACGLLSGPNWRWVMLTEENCLVLSVLVAGVCGGGKTLRYGCDNNIALKLFQVLAVTSVLFLQLDLRVHSLG